MEGLWCQNCHSDSEKTYFEFLYNFQKRQPPAGIRTHNQKSETEARGQNQKNLGSL